MIDRPSHPIYLEAQIHTRLAQESPEGYAAGERLADTITVINADPTLSDADKSRQAAEAASTALGELPDDRWALAAFRYGAQARRHRELVDAYRSTGESQ